MPVLARKLRLHDYFALAFGTMIGTGWLVLMDDWLGRGGPAGAALGFAIGGIILLPVGYVYGQWVKRSIALSLHPMPKRAEAQRIGDVAYLTLRQCEGESEPYSRAVANKTEEATQLKKVEQEAIEQPDGEAVDYDG